MYATYSEMKNLLSKQQDFKGNSVTAITEEVTRNGKTWCEYKVYSYSTLIFKFVYGDDEDFGGYVEKVKVFNNSYFSPTTSKLQNLLIDAYGLNDGKRKRS